MKICKYLIILLCGAGLTTFFCFYAHDSEESHIHREVDLHNSVVLDIVSAKFRSDVDNTFLPNALETAVLTQPFPNRELFQNYSSPSLAKKSTQIVHFCLKVTPEYRQEYVDEMTLQYPMIESFDIIDIDPAGVQTVAGLDYTMWPSTHVSIPSVTRPIGINFNSFASELIDKMILKGGPIVSDIFILPSLQVVPRPRTSVLVLQPVYVRDEIYGFVMDFVNIGTLLRHDVYISSPDVNFDISSLMIFKENVNGGYDTLFDFTDSPEFDPFLIQGYTLEYAKSRGEYCSLQRSVVDTESIFISVLCTNDSVVYTTILVPVLIGTLCTLIVCMVMFFLERDATLKKRIVATKEIEINKKSEFLSEMTHELRTPLNGIMGMCDMLNYSADNEETSEFLFYIKSGGKVLRTLIDNILEFSKVEAGKLNFRPTYENLYTKLETTCGLASAAHRKASPTVGSVYLKLDVCNNVPENVYLDHSRLCQVVTNMVSNASKFTDNGEVLVKVYASFVSDNQFPEYISNDTDVAFYARKCMIHIDVKDSGIGMSEENVSKLFQTFSQVHTDRSVGGSGLGLVVCKKICEDMGGDIVCSSVENEGTTFSTSYAALTNEYGVIRHTKSWGLTLPKNTHVEVPLKEKEEVQKDTELTVLIVDDFAMNIKLLQKVMQKNNVSVVSCNNGKKAVELSMEQKFDIIFIDLNMPIMNGSDATSLIRENVLNPNHSTNIVFLTGSAEEDIEDLVTGSGANKVVRKPFNIKEIGGILDAQRDRIKRDRGDYASHPTIDLSNIVPISIPESGEFDPSACGLEDLELARTGPSDWS